MNDNMEKKTFESVLKEKLGNHEMPVNPSLWKNVSSKAGLSSGSASLGIGSWLGIIIGIVTITAVGYYFTTSKKEVSDASPKKQEDKTRVNKPDLSAENVILSKGSEQYVPVEPDRIDQTIHGSTGTVIDEKPIEFSSEQTRELVDFQNNQEQLSTEVLPQKPISVVSNVSNSEPIPKENNTIIQTPKSSIFKPLVMPNAITPNGDGINDVLTLKTEGLSDFSLVVLDALNKVVFSTTDPNFVWNGLLPNGDLAPSGSYQYYFTAKDENGTWHHQFSSLTILR